MARYTPIQLVYEIVEPKEVAIDKAPIIFLHGATGSKEGWNDIPQVVADKTKRKVYVPDARNHGDSEWTDTFNFDCNVDDLVHFMDSHRIQRAILIGHSMGGITAIQTSLRMPERVEKLVVEDINVRKLNQQALDLVTMYMSLAVAAIQQVPADVDEETAKKMIFKIISQHLPPQVNTLTNRESDDHPIYLKRGQDGRYAFKSNLPVLLRAFKNAEDLMSEPEGTFEGPACFIYGTLSPFLVGSDADNTKKFFPNAEFVGIDGANHTVHNDSPKEFTQSLLNFLSQ